MRTITDKDSHAEMLDALYKAEMELGEATKWDKLLEDLAVAQASGFISPKMTVLEAIEAIIEERQQHIIAGEHSMRRFADWQRTIDNTWEKWTDRFETKQGVTA